MKKGKRNIPYQVPESYFEQLPQTVTNRIRMQKNSFLGIQFPLSLKVKMAVPLTIALLVLLLFYKPWSPNSIEVVSLDKALAKIPDSEVEAYLLSNEVSETELFEFFEENEGIDNILSEMPTVSAEELEGIVDTYDIEILF